MFQTVSTSEAPISVGGTALRCFWVVCADESYQVKVFPGEGRCGWIALRTLAGQGTVVMKDGQRWTVGADTLVVFDHSEVAFYGCVGGRWDFWWFEFFTDAREEAEDTEKIEDADGAERADGAAEGRGNTERIGGAMEVARLPVRRVVAMGVMEAESAEAFTCFQQLRRVDERGRAWASAAFVALTCRWAAESQASGERSAYGGAIGRVVEAMQKDLTGRRAMSEWAAMAGLGERRFRDVFAEVMGQSPKAYYDAMRIRVATEWLRMGHSVAAVAERLGYSSAFHFSRAFSAARGVAPSEYGRR